MPRVASNKRQLSKSTVMSTPGSPVQSDPTIPADKDTKIESTDKLDPKAIQAEDDAPVEEPEVEEQYDAEYEEYMREKHASNMLAMKQLLDHMSPDQLRRYEVYRSSALPKASIKKIINQILPSQATVPDKMAVVVGGVAKMFVGEVVEVARECLMEEQRLMKQPHTAQSLAIRPRHLREANRRIRQRGLLTNNKRTVMRPSILD